MVRFHHSLLPTTLCFLTDSNAIPYQSFWHVQHEFVEAEMRLLSRKGDLDVTALTGYAGGAVQADKGSNKVARAAAYRSALGSRVQVAVVHRQSRYFVVVLSEYVTGQPTSQVCYHNMMKDHEYSALGHAEAVALRIPPSSFQAFAEVYFNLFDERGGQRPATLRHWRAACTRPQSNRTRLQVENGALSAAYDARFLCCDAL